MTGEYGTGFRFDTLKNGLQRMYLDKRSELEDVQFVVSRTFNDKIQIVLTDKNGGVNSNNVATLMKADIDKGSFCKLIVLELSNFIYCTIL